METESGVMSIALKHPTKDALSPRYCGNCKKKIPADRVLSDGSTVCPRCRIQCIVCEVVLPRKDGYQIAQKDFCVDCFTHIGETYMSYKKLDLM